MTKTPDADEIWATRDGREIPLDEMHTPHVHNARKSMREWLKGEDDPDVRRDLARWHKRFGKELRKRQREWLEKRNASKRD
jgi:hypothetical protein